MSDVYEWVDPFEQRDRADRAERRAASAYADGQRSILRDVAGAQRERFGAVLEQAVHYAAERLVREKIAPHMAKSYEAFSEREYRMERGVREVERETSPLLAGIRSHGALALDVGPISASEASYVLSYEVVEPFRLNVSMTSVAWR